MIGALISRIQRQYVELWFFSQLIKQWKSFMEWILTQIPWCWITSLDASWSQIRFTNLLKSISIKLLADKVHETRLMILRTMSNLFGFSQSTPFIHWPPNTMHLFYNRVRFLSIFSSSCHHEHEGAVTWWDWKINSDKPSRHLPLVSIANLSFLSQCWKESFQKVVP